MTPVPHDNKPELQKLLEYVLNYFLNWFFNRKNNKNET